MSDGDVRVAIVAVDLLYVGAALRQEVLARLHGALPDQSLFFAASHTHFAPATSTQLPGLGEVDRDYVSFAAERIAKLLDELIACPKRDATIRYCEGRADHSVNRRRPRWRWDSGASTFVRYAAFEPNMKGKRDERLKLLEIRSSLGVECVIWSYCCHPVAYPKRADVTSDYPGAVRKRLRREIRPDIPVVFLQGFAGNLRPREIVSPRGVRGRVRVMLNRHYWSRFSIAEYERWVTTLAQCVCDTLHRPGRTLELDDGCLELARVTEPITNFVDSANGNSGKQLSLHCVSLAPDFRLIGISAEPVVEYGPLVESLFAGTQHLLVGYIDEVFGYLPMGDMLPQGGYEVSGFNESFSLEGRFRPDVEAQTVRALKRLTDAL